jgi:UDP-glucose 4-epimerase
MLLNNPIALQSVTDILKNKRILITGSSGYIAQNFIRLLFKLGGSTWSNADSSNLIFQIETMDKKNTFREDITSMHSFIDVFHHLPVDYVFHFAALKSVPDSNRFPLEYYSTNVTGTINLLKAMENSSSKHLIFSSSAAVYGNHLLKKDGFVETDQCDPCNVYGRTKLMCEQIIKDQCATGKLRAVILRYFNVYGGEYIDTESRNLHSVIEKCKKSGEPIEIYGSDYATRDGTAIRDYVSTNQLNDAHLLAIKYLSENPDVTFEIFNIGTNCGKTVLEIVNEAGIDYTNSDRRDGDPDVLIANSDKFSKLF